MKEATGGDVIDFYTNINTFLSTALIKIPFHIICINFYIMSLITLLNSFIVLPASFYVLYILPSYDFSLLTIFGFLTAFTFIGIGFRELLFHFFEGFTFKELTYNNTVDIKESYNKLKQDFVDLKNLIIGKEEKKEVIKDMASKEVLTEEIISKTTEDSKTENVHVVKSLEEKYVSVIMDSFDELFENCEEVDEDKREIFLREEIKILKEYVDGYYKYVEIKNDLLPSFTLTTFKDLTQETLNKVVKLNEMVKVQIKIQNEKKMVQERADDIYENINQYINKNKKEEMVLRRK